MNDPKPMPGQKPMDRRARSRRCALLPALFAAGCGFAAGASAQELKLRPGQWETRSVVTGDAAAAAPLGGAGTDVNQSCITAEDLENRLLGDDEEAEENCKRTFTTRTTTRWEGRYTCEGGDGGTFRIDAPTPERVTMAMVIRSGGAATRVNSEGRWVKAKCDPGLD
ncbi:MAG: DUF3617 domain-containing protein [Lautropia sp.]